MLDPKAKHLLELNLATILLSTSGVLGKVITLSAAQTIFFRCAIALVFVIVFAKATQRSLKVQRRDFWFFLLSGLLLACHWVSYFYAIHISTVAVAMISLFTFPVITTLLEPMVFKTRLSKLNLLSGLMVLVGIYLLVPEFDLANNITLGACAGLFSAFVFAIRNLMNKKVIGRHSSTVLMTYQLLVTVVFLFPTIFTLDDGALDPSNILYLAILGIVTTGMGQTLFVYSLRHFTASTASLILSIQPIYGILGAVLILGEKLALNTLIGGALIITTVFMESFRHYGSR